MKRDLLILLIMIAGLTAVLAPSTGVVVALILSAFACSVLGPMTLDAMDDVSN